MNESSDKPQIKNFVITEMPPMVEDDNFLLDESARLLWWIRDFSHSHLKPVTRSHIRFFLCF